MVLKLSFTIVLIATLALFTSYTPQAEAHSWADCIDWKGANGRNDFKNGKCNGYARRFPTSKKYSFGSLDSASPNRHYEQDHDNPNSALPCSDGKHGEETGANETRAKNIKDAYDPKKGYGKMTVARAGQTLCVRWPAKNHSKEYKVPNVQIHMARVPNRSDISQRELIRNTIANLPYGNCNSGSSDRRPCGGCFKVPTNRKPGVYLLQWRWMLNKNEWYTSCADVQIR
ncbi:hypothetical protein BX616_005096 [Lobosporangium transversale]|uniref:Chitin-binding type-4 domain-containing protein n=1 Tax=Lobosporangium transversale TaxID=64571 RepID=A0A1Y2GKB7_9FUNG|nr:hypothetical protein BCR41DRAFT_355804 [Lobosporangium transversale]KAF9897720.1 hypothetical protein BX616_005096 [Lobosporangium transversale]ORZ13458.1 hypothetical protein BCR41DRAFT_355804 [Lobosporangium transversale]|eukprot:XP_021880539.1 hypothetical protein BCR41DRAFT_355804 [Lobosporangium transversale]